MLKINREKLLPLLQMVVGVVERRHTLPILSHVLIQIKAKKLIITATDLEVQLSANCELDDEAQDEEFTLPGRKLFDICKMLPDKAVLEFHLEPHQVVIKSKKSRFNLSRLSTNEFPQLEKEQLFVETVLTKQALYFLLEYTHFAMAQQDVRYFLNGMLMEFTLNKMTAVSSDGHRMALAWQTNLAIETTDLTRVIIPRKGVMELMRLLSANESETIKLSVGTHHIQFTADDFILSSKLIDGKFPDYQRALPNNGDKTVVICTDEFKEVLQRVSVLLDKNRTIRIELAENKLKASVSNMEQEEAEEEIAIDYNSISLTLGFNVTYLLDVMHAIKSPTFKMILKDANSGVLFEEIDNEAAIFVVMPMKI